MSKYDDLIKAMSDPSFSRKVSGLSRDEVKELFGEKVAAMYRFDQKNPYHCHDLLTHSAITVDGIDGEKLTEDEYVMMRIAALFHDIGKPTVAAWSEKKNRQVFFGHAARSAELAEKYFESIGMPKELIERTCFMIRHHDDFMNYRTEEQMKDNENQYFVPVTVKSISDKICKNAKADPYKASLRDYQLLIRLCRADALAQKETAIENGKVLLTRPDRMEVLKAIEDCINTMSAE